MITTISPYSDPRNRALAGSGFDGVVRITTGGSYGTGTLLYDGRTIITAAHLLSNGMTNVSVVFETLTGTNTWSTGGTVIHPEYDPSNSNNDLALIRLTSTAPTTAERYEIYRSSDELGKIMTMVGYGTPGTGSSGTLSGYAGSALRLKADNHVDTTAEQLKTSLGNGIAWTPLAKSQLLADFDDGTVSHDALGELIGVSGLGVGDKEGLISRGDSGGPAFLNNQIAGIASYAASLSKTGASPDIDQQSNSSIGEIAAWQRVSHYQQWIDQNIRQNFSTPPSRPEEVQRSIIEGNSSTRYAYFLLQFNGARSDPQQTLSVEYRTVDGTAQAGSDYISSRGTLKLYPNETQTVIPIEILGDNVPEPDETFFLEVTNPVGGSFGSGQIKLIAMRTIVDDDGWLGVAGS